MARVGRKKHVQLPLLNRSGTGKARIGRNGKPHPGGRPRKAGPRKTDHVPRPSVQASRPVHVVLRVRPVVGNLRVRDAYRAVRRAGIVVARRGQVVRAGRATEVKGDIRRAGRAFGAFRVVHISIQRTHVHLLVEADDRVALSRGMQAFQISAARQLNARLARRGKVFADRYHASTITNPRQARNALAYVLNNWRKHREGGGIGWRVDPFSTAARFDGWRRADVGRDGHVETGWGRSPPEDEMLVAGEPRSWLLRVGWERYGAIGVSEVPSTPPWVEQSR